MPYIPILFTSHRWVKLHDRLRLTFAAMALAEAQGIQPEIGKIIYGPNFKSSKINLLKLLPKVREIVAKLRAIQHSVATPALVLNRHCPECEFRQSCHAIAVEKDDLSLLRNVNPKQIVSLNSRGIFTVTQYSHAFRPARMRYIAAKEPGRHDTSLQALAIRERKIYIARRNPVPDAKVRIYLDVEGLAEGEHCYLIGILIEHADSSQKMESHWADSNSDEAAIWAALLQTIENVGEDFVIFHYGNYEARVIRRLAKVYGGDPALITKIESRCVNAVSLIYAHIFFPSYGNDLKSIAGFLGFKWSVPDANGLQAIVWRHDWEGTRDPEKKQLLLTYNQEDCAALKSVIDVIRKLMSNAPATEPVPDAVDVKDLQASRPHKFCNPNYVQPEFAQITKCAYFDYQRDRVLFRTSPIVRQANGRRRKAARRIHPVNQLVEFEAAQRCPKCRSKKLDSRAQSAWTVVDLKLTKCGLKRWVTRYTARRSKCLSCSHIFLPDGFLPIHGHKYGWAFCGWVAYASVAMRQVSRDTADCIADMFDVRITSGMVGNLMEQAAERYKETYESILAELRNGSLVHADETWVRVKGLDGKGYVWVFANPELALYHYSPTRESDTVRDVLSGFKGVLVSDFYTAYDSFECPQQKCLVHLVRDINDDLAKNPFDEELKKLASRFALLMQRIVETIDRHGLKSYYLRKHKNEATSFIDQLPASRHQSELATYYRRRFIKYQDKLFTFLDYDGVPWSNNNAENAIKRFVSRRKGMQGTAAFSERGIRNYLTLLTIYQTLRYRHFNFWQFLVSGETDIQRFVGKLA